MFKWALLLFFVASTLGVPGVHAVHYEWVTDVWSWGASNPLGMTPQEIATTGLPQSRYTGGEDSEEWEIRDIDNEWVTKTTINDFAHHYVYLYTDYKPKGYDIILQWKVGVSGGAVVKLYYWDSNSWEPVADGENGGGEYPAIVTTYVQDYFNYRDGNYYLHILAVGDTDAGEKSTHCDCAFFWCYPP